MNPLAKDILRAMLPHHSITDVLLAIIDAAAEPNSLLSRELLAGFHRAWPDAPAFKPDRVDCAEGFTKERENMEITGTTNKHILIAQMAGRVLRSEPQKTDAPFIIDTSPITQSHASDEPEPTPPDTAENQAST